MVEQPACEHGDADVWSLQPRLIEWDRTWLDRLEPVASVLCGAGAKNGPTVCEPVRGNVVMVLPLLTLLTLLTRMAWHMVPAPRCPSDSRAPTLARLRYGHRQRSGVYAPALSAAIA